MADKRDLMIAMDPHMAAKFQASTHMSRKYHEPLTVADLIFVHSEQGNLCQYAQDVEQAPQNLSRDPCLESRERAGEDRCPIEACYV